MRCLRVLLLFVLVTAAVLILTGCQIVEYYVSPTTGVDDPTSGTQANPWASIGYALSAIPANQPAGTVVRLHLDGGVYIESSLVITRSIAIVGTGAEQVTIMGRSPGGTFLAIRGRGLSSPLAVLLSGMTLRVPDSRVGISVDSASFGADGVTIYQPANYGIVLTDCVDFSIAHTSMATVEEGSTEDYLNPADIGVLVYDSSGKMSNLRIEPNFDHGIDIHGSDVTIEDSAIVASRIAWADGIRVYQEPSRVTVRRTTIQRAPQPQGMCVDAYCSAGIEISMDRGVGSSEVRIEQCTIEGPFLYGVEIGEYAQKVVIESSSISGHQEAAVHCSTCPAGSLCTQLPEIDLGGGTLGGQGGNTFGTTEKYAIHHVGSVTVYALKNYWGVPPSDLPGRIYDKTDDPTLPGEVKY